MKILVVILLSFLFVLPASATHGPSNWFAFNYIEPAQTLALALLLTLPLSILFMGKKRSLKRRVVELTSLVVAGFFTIRW